MSLKAKIEAVIYASEEPVTLAQLTGLLGLEAQAELDRLDSAQQSLALEGETVSATGSESDLEGLGDPPAANMEPAAAGPGRAPSQEPEPTDASPSQEPEPTDDSPIPEHPTEPPPATPGPKSARQDDKARDRRLREHFRSILDELIADYATSERGLEIREVASGYRLATKPEYHDAVRGFVKSLKPPLKLSLQALETLAVVAYKQPITAPEISEIRGVDSGGVLGSLMARKLITTAGRKQVIGRPILYKTTRDFLLRFGLKDVSELPSIEEFEKMAGELADTFAEPVQEEIHMQTEAAESPAELEEEKDATEPQSDGDSIPLEGSDEASSGAPGKTVATPEGDNEFAPDQPLQPIDEGHQKPPAIDTNHL
jgi:segregation and condensation protein B